ncbi:TetR/AcrR family transcriptional regulator [Psychromonas sp. GE-S-Ul-11]|uniref:TetR/AcrR family transcriptional regulator n=1 Tax=Psychromonas sp. GE-S-Ul-11 TaxID=3241170 RepID=UPI00390C8C0F
MLKQQIAARLETAFSQHGFAKPSVAQLKNECEVSLRTLYKYFPSKETMIVAALEYRHQRYLAFLLENAPEPGTQCAVHIFKQLELWMHEYAPHGCLSMNAIAAFPDNSLVTAAVQQHKQDVRIFLGKQSLREESSMALFLLHEGVSSAWPLLGKSAVSAAQQTLLQLLGDE